MALVWLNDEILSPVVVPTSVTQIYDNIKHNMWTFTKINTILIPTGVSLVLCLSDVVLTTILIFLCLIYINIRVRFPSIQPRHVFLFLLALFYYLIVMVGQWYRFFQLFWVSFCIIILHSTIREVPTQPSILQITNV